ncbi:hypothetical protein ACFYMW_09595 [Streptomyces sp. NPDC006692]|uniref:hypothetical protein n=1 Tax=unclassified Streptomyces TaxID=2593676 RepID=UPI0036A25FB9
MAIVEAISNAVINRCVTGAAGRQADGPTSGRVPAALTETTADRSAQADMNDLKERAKR